MTNLSLAFSFGHRNTDGKVRFGRSTTPSAIPIASINGTAALPFVIPSEAEGSAVRLGWLLKTSGSHTLSLPRIIIPGRPLGLPYSLQPTNFPRAALRDR
jgi:hypothetical protein